MSNILLLDCNTIQAFFLETRSKEKVGGGGGKKANATWGTIAAAGS